MKTLDLKSLGHSLRQFSAMASAGVEIRDLLTENALSRAPAVDFSHVLREVYQKHGLGDVFGEPDDQTNMPKFEFSEQVQDCLLLAQTELKMARAYANEEIDSIGEQPARRALLLEAIQCAETCLSLIDHLNDKPDADGQTTV